MPKLTKRTVDTLKPYPDRDLVVFDSEVSGFGVRVKSSGRKSYLIQYRNAGGRSRRLTIAGHGRMTADEARDEAKQLLAAAARGQDPAEERHRALRAPTVAQLAALYLERHARPRKKTAIADESMLRRYILPAFGARKVEAITRGDVARLHHELGDKPLAANRVLALISVMFNLAESWGLRAPASNPCRHLKRYPERKRERFLNAEEVQRLGAALVESQGVEHPSALAAIRLSQQLFPRTSFYERLARHGAANPVVHGQGVAGGVPHAPRSPVTPGRAAIRTSDPSAASAARRARSR